MPVKTSGQGTESAYTLLWGRERCAALRKVGEEGRPLRVLFGGVHQSAPSLKRAAIRPGDLVFPVSVHKGVLYVLAGVVIKEFVELATYAVTELGLKQNEVVGLPEFDLQQLITDRCGNLGHRTPYGCDIEVAILRASTPLRFDIAVSPEHLNEIQFCPRNGEPAGLKHVVDGKLKSAVSLHGNVRRLCQDTSNLFQRLVSLSVAVA